MNNRRADSERVLRWVRSGCQFCTRTLRNGDDFSQSTDFADLTQIQTKCSVQPALTSSLHRLLLIFNALKV